MEVFVRKNVFIVATMLLSMLCMNGYAEKKVIDNAVVDKHYGWFSVRGGYSALLEKFDDITTQGGCQFGVGGGYEYRYSWFYLSAGVDISYWSSNATTISYQFDRRMYDTQGKLMTYHYELDPSREHSYGFTAAVPFIVGVNYRGFYCGVGAIVGYHLLSMNQVTRPYTTSATYEQYIEDFTDMPNHYYANYIATNKEKLDLHFPVNLTAEIGYDVLYGYSYSSYSRDRVLKIGAYVEYSMVNAFRNKSDGSVFEINPEHPTQLLVYSYYRNKATTTNRVVPLSVGVKLTIMLRMPTRSCRCKDNFNFK